MIILQFHLYEGVNALKVGDLAKVDGIFTEIGSKGAETGSHILSSVAYTNLQVGYHGLFSHDRFGSRAPAAGGGRRPIVQSGTGHC